MQTPRTAAAVTAAAASGRQLCRQNSASPTSRMRTVKVGLTMNSKLRLSAVVKASPFNPPYIDI